MKYLSLVLVLCGIASFGAGPAWAFDIEGEKANLQDGVAPFSDPGDQLVSPDYAKGNSLALPYISKSDSSSAIPEYGNMIVIPGPGVDRPAPAWAYR